MSDEKPVVTEVKETTLTGEQQLELERLRAERAGHERTIEELRAKDRDRNVKDTFKREVEKTGIRSHHSDAELVTVLNKEEGVVITPSGDGRELHCEVDGKATTFQAVLEAYAVKHPNEFDGRTIRSLIDKGSDAIKSRQDMTPEEKRAFIDRNGALAYERLGLYRAPTLDPKNLTADDWKHLTYAQKSKVISDAPNGELVVSEILKRKAKQ